MNEVEPCRTAGEIAEALKITRSMVLNFARTGQIPSIKLGMKTIRFRLTEGLDALRAHSGSQVLLDADTEVTNGGTNSQ